MKKLFYLLSIASICTTIVTLTNEDNENPRGVPIESGKVYCPRRDRVVSEENLGPRQYRNRRPGRGLGPGRPRGIPTESGKIYCPERNQVVSSEADLGPRRFRNQRPGRGLGRGRGRGRGLGLGRR